MKTMDRLTIKIPYENDNYTLMKLCSFRNGEIYNIDGCEDRCEQHANSGEDCTNCDVQIAFNRLAAYEDTGLTPEEINAMKIELSRFKGT